MKLNIFWIVSVVHMLYFAFVLYCCYCCSCVWYLTPIIEVFCLLLFFFLLRKCYGRYEISVTKDHGYVLFVVITITFVSHDVSPGMQQEQPNRCY